MEKYKDRCIAGDIICCWYTQAKVQSIWLRSGIMMQLNGIDLAMALWCILIQWWCITDYMPGFGPHHSLRCDVKQFLLVKLWCRMLVREYIMDKILCEKSAALPVLYQCGLWDFKEIFFYPWKPVWCLDDMII